MAKELKMVENEGIGQQEHFDVIAFKSEALKAKVNGR
jgi:hypothetical protein